MIAPGYIVLRTAIASFVFSDETLQSGLDAYPRVQGQRFTGAQVSVLGFAHCPSYCHLSMPLSSGHVLP